ncbi:hypothetical protein M422DRAFT_260720 [Sphaerobolus stellatus SS14]|uniref:Uncharacterized protein n=1 Tax=Sphaerobolus stellatus (strain SS14) TaxID=990650 RepID=A0A0C9U247_SPHS4|nr:hypothetical protein M422DRAFT_260720 [Sphaerobolus stellatus SS14]
MGRIAGVKSSEYKAFADEWIQPRNMASLLIISVLELREESPSTARSILDISPEIKNTFLEIVKELDTADQPL